MLSTYVTIAGLYILAIVFNRSFWGMAPGSGEWLANLAAMLGFATAALVTTGGLFGCPYGSVTGNVAVYSQAVAILGSLSLFTIFRK